jgi:hypothetical protein
VAVAAPNVAVTFVSDGSEKYVFSHAAGEEKLISASLVNVTTRLELAPTVSAEVRTCELPVTPVEKFQETKLVVLPQPVWATDKVLAVKPPAYIVLSGSCTAVNVTGPELGLVIVATTSPTPPGYKRLVGAGDATAEIVILLTTGDCPWPLDPLLRLTIHSVAAPATTPTKSVPATPVTNLPTAVFVNFMMFMRFLS